ncbi:MAG: hypothetical protein BWX78_00669 [Firmicutes bacterium ADurb.Bin099]|nr:MAG: hypothetical protein BWX78_00669 [Firmicutes bacterium ADurb.Bin099]
MTLKQFYTLKLFFMILFWPFFVIAKVAGIWK